MPAVCSLFGSSFELDDPLRLINSRSQRKAFGILAVEILFMVAVVLGVILGAHTHEKRSMIVGILCVIFGSMMYASPLTIMVRDRSSIRPLFYCACRILLLSCVDNLYRRGVDQVAIIRQVFICMGLILGPTCRLMVAIFFNGYMDRSY
jgi:hypothetical protein